VSSSVPVLRQDYFCECRSLSSITFESGSRLSRIPIYPFRDTGLVEITIAALVEVLGAFLNADHFPRLHLHQGQDCHELNGGHSVELAWLK
jgi:hypothetical protein